ncbi:sensor histidine kinase [Cohnella nanjingensis]|uniref:Histidine kinase n=1 Tax=Cohnella nanjingensis TaxID=1387779 RepID=A0A7X0RMD1_9BACL|nr:histidine kinase [Cohnella nanjingensis]MBB6670197.1 histidine kinase [Cohnella nanjingensis]
MYSEISQSMISRLKFYSNLLDLEFDKVIRFQNEFVNDDDLIELSGKSEIMTDPEKAFAMLHLQKRLLQLKYASSYIQDVKVYIPSISYVISANKLYDDLPESEFAALQQLKAQSTSPFIQWEGRLFIPQPNPGWTYLDHKPPVYLLAVEISKATLEKTLGSLSIGEDGIGFISGGNRAWTVASRPDHSNLLSDLESGEETRGDRNPFTWIQSNKRYTVFREKLDHLGATVYMSMLETELTGQLKRYNMWYWTLSLLSIVAIILFATWIFRTIQQPLRKLVRAFRRLETGDLSVVVGHGGRDEFHYLYSQFNVTVQKLNVLIEEVYEQKYRVQLSELRQLQSQINPHFLYNSFFSMQAMARLGDLNGIDKYTKFLGEYFQYVTRNGQTDVPLANEIHHVIVYTEIQKIRFRNRIESRIEEIPPSYADFAVPRLILQPLVENAFKYGLENKKAGGLLVIGFRADASGLRIILEDNGESVSEEQLERLNALLRTSQLEGETTGLINVHRRLQIKFGSSGGLTVSRGPLGGFKVVVAFPAKTEE